MTSASGYDGFLQASEFEDKDNEGGLGVYMYLYDTTNDVAVPYDTARQYITVKFIQDGAPINAKSCDASQFNSVNLAYSNSTIYDHPENANILNGLICPELKNMTSIKPLSLNVEVRTCEGNECSQSNFDNYIYDKVLVTKMFTKKMDFSKIDDPETGSYFHMDYTIGRFQLNKYTRFYSKVALRFNLVELFDSYFQMGLSSEAERKYFLDHSFAESENLKINIDSQSTG